MKELMVLSDTNLDIPATYEWCVALLDYNNVGSQYRGDSWLPAIYNPRDRHVYLEMRPGVTRREVVQVWHACGGDDINQAELDGAHEADLSR